MKLFINQKFSIGDKYKIVDENNNLRFEVKSKFFSIRHKKYLTDAKGTIFCRIQRKFWDILPKYLIYDNANNLLAKISRKFSLGKSFNISSTFGHYEIKGDIFAWSFTIYRDGNLVGAINKKIVHIKDSYIMDIANAQDAPLFISFVIAIDNLCHNNNK